jgi:hypothetical protein
VHLKTKDDQFNRALKSALGRIYARHTATLTREEAKRAWDVVGEVLESYQGTKTLDIRNEAKSLRSACLEKAEGL